MVPFQKVESLVDCVDLVAQALEALREEVLYSGSLGLDGVLEDLIEEPVVKIAGRDILVDEGFLANDLGDLGRDEGYAFFPEAVELALRELNRGGVPSFEVQFVVSLVICGVGTKPWSGKIRRAGNNRALGSIYIPVFGDEYV
ncbi:MAG TPA: hypothetical protein PLU93_07465 [Treponemataceae bacterium]|nr:hypothetical protein [Treponemataceae bacterium]